LAIGGILMQNGKPVIFKSKRLDETKWRWPTHEKEMWLWYIALRLGAITWLQGCGGVDWQCHFEILCHCEVTFRPSAPGSTRWSCLKAQMLLMKEKYKCRSRC
jgi:hypothetical protein